MGVAEWLRGVESPEARLEAAMLECENKLNDLAAHRRAPR